MRQSSSPPIPFIPSSPTTRADVTPWIPTQSVSTSPAPAPASLETFISPGRESYSLDDITPVTTPGRRSSLTPEIKSPADNSKVKDDDFFDTPYVVSPSPPPTVQKFRLPGNPRFSFNISLK